MEYPSESSQESIGMKVICIVVVSQLNFLNFVFAISSAISDQQEWRAKYHIWFGWIRIYPVIIPFSPQKFQ